MHAAPSRIAYIAGVAVLVSSCVIHKNADQPTAHPRMRFLSPQPETIDLSQLPDKLTAGDEVWKNAGAVGEVGPRGKLIAAVPVGGEHVATQIAIFENRSHHPHLIQVLDAKGSIQDVFVADGALSAHVSSFDGSVPVPVVFAWQGSRFVQTSAGPLPLAQTTLEAAHEPYRRPVRTNAILHDLDVRLTKLNDGYPTKLVTEVELQPEEGGAPNFYYTVDEDAWYSLSEAERKALVRPGGALFDITRDVWIKDAGTWCFGDAPDTFIMLHVVNQHHVDVGLDYVVFVHRRECP